MAQWQMSARVQHQHHFKEISCLAKWLTALQNLDAKLEALNSIPMTSTVERKNLFRHVVL